MSPQKTFNHHAAQALAALASCPAEFIGPAVKSLSVSLERAKYEAIAREWAKGQTTDEIDRLFGYHGAVFAARNKLGHNKMPMRYGTVKETYPVAWLDELKKPGDVTTIPMRNASHRNTMFHAANQRGIQISTKTRGVPKGFVRVTCVGHIGQRQPTKVAV